jgi:Rrf2 family cysteine metabolism transcriptional repressor
MFSTPKKHQYAIRAILELAKHMGAGPIKISDIARAQAIPRRFLEVILNQLKGSGLLLSKRGFTGGYCLVVSPRDITVGDIVRYLDRGSGPRECLGCESEQTCPFFGRCAFSPLWARARQALFKIYDETTFQDLLENENRASKAGLSIITPENPNH